MAVKYSIPSNYNILNVGSLKGIVRQGKDGDKWIWEPHYTSLLVSRTFGKILVAYKDAISQDNVYKISNYNQKESYLNMPIYDIIFGESSLLIYTLDKNGELSWCAVDETLTKGKFLGDFEIITRNADMPNYIPVGIQRMLLQNESGIYHLDLKTYEMRAQKSVNSIKEKEEARKVVDTHCKFIADGDKLQCIGLQSNKEIASLLISELQAYKSVIEAMVGNLNKVEIETANEFIRIVKKFEVYTSGIAFYILSLYANYDSIAASNLDKLKRLNMLLNDDKWYKYNDRSYKIYTFKSLILSLCKIGDKRITTNLSAEIESGLFDENSNKLGMLEIVNIDTTHKITDSKELKNWKIPVSIENREQLSKDIKEHSYESVEIDEVSIKDNISIEYAVCNNFMYKSNSGKNKAKQNTLIKTNINSIMLLSVNKVETDEVYSAS